MNVVTVFYAKPQNNLPSTGRIGRVNKGKKPEEKYFALFTSNARFQNN